MLDKLSEYLTISIKALCFLLLVLLIYAVISEILEDKAQKKESEISTRFNERITDFKKLIEDTLEEMQGLNTDNRQTLEEMQELDRKVTQILDEMQQELYKQT